MPTYGYRCQSCSRDFDVWQRMSDQPGAACPACGGAGRRQFFPAGIVFKGSGFYKTDSRNGAAATVAAAGTGSGSAATSAPAASTPAAKDGGSTGGDRAGGREGSAAPAAASSGD